MKNLRENLLYLLLLVPTTTELLETGHFPSTSLDIITDIAMTLVVLALILVSRKKEKKIERLKQEIQQSEMFDTLTGLPLRERFNDDLKFVVQHAKDHRNHLRLVCIDIDHFKTVNEHYGSVMGDDILKNLVQQMKVIVPENRGRLYRLGGDTFALLFSEEATQETETIITNLVTLNASGDKLLDSYQSSITVGTAILSPNDQEHDFWNRAVQDMRQKRKEIEQQAA